MGQPKGSEGLSEGSEGLPEGSGGLPGGLGGDGRTDVRTDGRTDGRTEFLPILQDFVPCRGRCPKTKVKRRRKLLAPPPSSSHTIEYWLPLVSIDIRTIVLIHPFSRATLKASYVKGLSHSQVEFRIFVAFVGGMKNFGSLDDSIAVFYVLC